MKLHKWADLEKKLFTPERLAKIDGEVKKELRKMRRKEIKHRLDMPYTFEFTRNSAGSFFVKVREFKGCVSEGDTIEEAYAMIRDAMVEWMKTMLDDRQAIPEPRSKILKIPKFKSDKEAAEFWETHSLDDFDDDLEIVKNVRFVRSKKKAGASDLEAYIDRQKKPARRPVKSRVS